MALDRATGDWVLLMDADEQATHDLGEEILRAVSSPAAADGYRIRRILYHLGHYYSHAIYPDTPVRLFRRERGHIGGRDPHDKVVVEGRVERLDKPILHFSYRDISDHVATINRFSSRAAMEQEPNAFTPFKMIANPAWRFFNFYIIRGGLPRRRTRIVRRDDGRLLRVPEIREALRAPPEIAHRNLSLRADAVENRGVRPLLSRRRPDNLATAHETSVLLRTPVLDLVRTRNAVHAGRVGVRDDGRISERRRNQRRAGASRADLYPAREAWAARAGVAESNRLDAVRRCAARRLARWLSRFTIFNTGAISSTICATTCSST